MKVYTLRYFRENLFSLLRGPSFKITRHNRPVATVLTGDQQFTNTPPPEPQVAPPAVVETPPPEKIEIEEQKAPTFLMGHCEAPGIKCTGIPVVRVKTLLSDWETGEKEVEFMLCRVHYDKLKREGTPMEVLN